MPRMPAFQAAGVSRGAAGGPQAGALGCRLSSCYYYIVLYPVHLVTSWYVMLEIITLYHMYQTVLHSVVFLSHCVILLHSVDRTPYIACPDLRGAMRERAIPFLEFVIFKMLGDILHPQALPSGPSCHPELPLRPPLAPRPHAGRPAPLLLVPHLVWFCPRHPPPGAAALSPTGFVRRSRLEVALLPLKRRDPAGAASFGGPPFQQGQDPGVRQTPEKTKSRGRGLWGPERRSRHGPSRPVDRAPQTAAGLSAGSEAAAPSSGAAKVGPPPAGLHAGPLQSCAGQ